jgi:hypothetical protein
MLLEHLENQQAVLFNLKMCKRVKRNYKILRTDKNRFLIQLRFKKKFVKICAVYQKLLKNSYS